MTSSVVAACSGRTSGAPPVADLAHSWVPLAALTLRRQTVLETPSTVRVARQALSVALAGKTLVGDRLVVHVPPRPASSSGAAFWAG